MSKLTPKLKEFLEEEGYVQLKEIEGRGICGVRKFIFTYGLIYGLDESGFKGRWCYDNYVEPVVALHNWDGIGDPKGNWIKYKGEDGERSRIEKDYSHVTMFKFCDNCDTRNECQTFGCRSKDDVE